MQGNAWGMLYSALGLFVYVIISGADFSLSAPASYWYSLVYLSVFGTVIAFACYFVLLGNTIVLTPTKRIKAFIESNKASFANKRSIPS